MPHRRPRLLLPFTLATLAALITAGLLWHPLVTDVGPVRSTPLTLRPYFPLAQRPPYNKRIALLSTDWTTLAEAVENLSKLYDVPIVIDWPALESAGFRRTAHTNGTRILNPTLGSALDLTLKETLGLEDLTHHRLDDGAIHISTAKAFDRFTVTGQDYVGNDVISPHFATLPSRLKLHPAAGNPSALERWGIDTLLRPGPSDPRDRTAALITEITSTIDPPSWDDVNIAAMGTPGDNLTFIVEQTAENHRRIAALLARHRRRAALAAFAGRTLALLLLTLAATALLITARHFVLRRRVPEGFCPHCRYDLRATPDRCPECGAIPA